MKGATEFLEDLTDSANAKRCLEVQCGRSELQKQLDKFLRTTSPFAVVPKDPGLRLLIGPTRHWIAEVAFIEWSADGSIRHPAFQGLREDKNPT